mmetsp:Transcript_27910/g.56238  ORF Transcript_27910/g.56238 Transcript_27910/m.56238 type:complete len:459 (+) Transcript_27910:67-1443(+)
MGTSTSSEAAKTEPPAAPPRAAAAPEEKKPSYWEQASDGYEQLVNAIIRPPRAEYEDAHLGPREFKFAGRQFRRRDFNLRNERGMKIVCSHWEPFDRERRAAELPCIVYMHGNSSARVEAVPQLSLALSLGATLLAFDFTGSGQSDGEYVSLGFFEREDLKAVIQHLRSSARVSTVALWGRSMGAATSLMHGDRDPSIAAMVLDSPFADLTQLAEEMVDKGREQGLVVPGFVVSIAISFLRGSVKKNAGFNIKDISPIKRVDQCFIPALFVAGEGDDFIHPRHSQMIHAKYSGDKNLVMVEGDHNSPRPRFLYDSAAIFLQTYLQISPEWALTEVDPFNGGYPPWVSRGVFAMRPNIEFEEDGDGEENGQGVFEPSSVDLNDGVHLGMTAERQMQTQRALLSMLGGGGGGSAGEKNYTAEVPTNNFPVSAIKEWPCGVCTLINRGASRACTACGGEKP